MKSIEFFAGNRSVLCIVAETVGSCPGSTGFKMAVTPSGPSLGSVGGGGLEHRIICIGRRMMEEGETGPVLRSFSHSSDAEPGERSGMICSGRQKIILAPSPPLNRLTEKTKGIEVSPRGLRFLPDPPDDPGLHDEEGEGWYYTEALKPPPVAYLFGGGHCSKALTPILAHLGIRAVVIDDREHVWTMEENTEAYRRIRLDYTLAHTVVPDDGEALVVIMTASHGGDALVLEQMLGKKLGYLGMMASKTTASHIMRSMREKGFSEERIKTVHSPVGIPISSHTPAEIAVSIAAEIIKVMNGRQASGD